jgi:hypothetical protein
MPILGSGNCGRPSRPLTQRTPKTPMPQSDPAMLTVRVGYQAAGLDLHGRRCCEMYHAVVTGEPVRYGFLTRYRGDALCGAVPLTGCPPGLFPPSVSCPSCITIAMRESIRLDMGSI